MKKIIVLAMTMVFLWTGVSFAEKWIMYYDGDTMKAFFDAERVHKSGNGFDFWTRDTLVQPVLGQKYLVQHYQVELQNSEWWIRQLESWYIDAQGKEGEHYPADNWSRMNWSNEPYGVALLDGLRKYGR